MAMVTMEMMTAYESQVNNKFAVLNDQVQAALASALANIDTTIQTQFEAANVAFKEERARVEATINATAEAVQNLSSGSVEKLSEQIANINAREETFKDLLSGLHAKTSQEVEARLAYLNAAVESLRDDGRLLQSQFQQQSRRPSVAEPQSAEHHDISQGRGANRRAPKLQIPKVKEWSLEVLKDKSNATAKDQG